jgi:hypothetical protein
MKLVVVGVGRLIGPMSLPTMLTRDAREVVSASCRSGLEVVTGVAWPMR